VRLEQAWTVPGVGAGRPDYSKNVQQAVRSMMVDRQSRWIANQHTRLLPDTSVVALPPIALANSVTNVDVTSNADILFDVYLHLFRVFVEPGQPAAWPQDVEWIAWLGWKAGFGKVSFRMNQGLFIPGHQRYYMGIEVWNYHAATQLFRIRANGMYEAHWE